MMLLPIVDRELRVVARRRSTYGLRIVLALVVSFLWFLLLSMLPGALPLQRGPTVFRIVASMAFAFCLLAGVFLSADSVCQEKREGTLGLLFLTSLKGYDVVLGKLLASSLQAVYGLLAVLPVFALAMLIGGVTFGEFFRLTLALLVTLLLSLSAGLLVSSFSRDLRQSMLLSLALISGLSLLFPLLGWLLWLGLKSGAWKWIVWPSPLSVFTFAFDRQFYSPNGVLVFLGALFTVAVLAGASLVLASWLVPRIWSNQSDADKPSMSRLLGGSAPDEGFRSEALERNPYFWLAGRDKWPQRLVRILTTIFWPIFLILITGSFLANSSASLTTFCVSMVLVFGMHQALKWLMASEACRRLCEDRQSGALELLLVTPLSVKQIIEGQRLALRRLFLFPMLFGIAANAWLVCALRASRTLSLAIGETTVLYEVFICGAVLMLVDFYALGWIGMRSAFRVHHHHRAILMTLAQVILVPWFTVGFLVLLIMGGAGLGHAALRVLTVLWFALAAVMVISHAVRAKAELNELFRNFSVQPSGLSANQTHPLNSSDAAETSSVLSTLQKPTATPHEPASNF